MIQALKQAAGSRPVFLCVGALATLLVALFTWVQLAAPVNLRFPVVSPDGNYFAYLDASGASGDDSRATLVISTRDSGEERRFNVSRGAISWSNANHLAVVDVRRDLATLVTLTGGRHVVLTTLSLAGEVEPRWSRDGTKLAYLRPSARGPELAVYDITQTLAWRAPLAGDVRISGTELLAWSPGGDELFFVNSTGGSTALVKLDLLEGKVSELARVQGRWEGFGRSKIQFSPDGNRAYLPRPTHAVIETRGGQTLWTPPPEAKVLWSAWSADSRRLYYSRGDAPQAVFSHDFANPSEQRLVAGVGTNGFFSLDGRSFFYRQAQGPETGFFARPRSQWFEGDWGWRQVDVVSQRTAALGRVELWPWAETSDGLITAREDRYVSVSYGLYDPNARKLVEFDFPTDREDVTGQIKSHAALMATFLLYGLLGLIVYLRRPRSAPARAMALMCSALMVLFAALAAVVSAFSLASHLGMPNFEYLVDTVGLGWYPRQSFQWILFEDFGPAAFFTSLALVPPALLHFALVFPEDNRFLAGRRKARAALYAAAFLPFAGLLFSLIRFRLPAVAAPIVGLLVSIAAVLALVTALAAVLYNYRHPPDRRSKDQVRWMALAFSVPPVGLALLMGADLVYTRIEKAWGVNPPHGIFFQSLLGATALSALSLFTPLAIGYALVAHKLFDINLLLRRTARYSMLTSMVLAVYLALAGGLSWAITGSLRNPSEKVIIASTLLTAAVLAPARRRIEGIIDRTFAPASFGHREVMDRLAAELPNIVDRQTLARRLSEAVQQLLEPRGFHLFLLHGAEKNLKAQAIGDSLPAEVAEMEFDPAEPLCRYLLNRRRPFEAEVSPYDPKLLPIFVSAAERLGKLGAAVVVGLERRGELVGFMTVGPKASDEFYNSEELRLLATLAGQAAVAAYNIDLFEEVAQDRELKKELEVASEVQAHLFPSAVPASERAELAGRCIPARSVSGDYYDFLALPGRRIAVAICDVSGKGVSASLLMANLQGLLRSQAPMADNPAELARRINRQLHGSSSAGRYCTFFYGVFHEEDSTFDFVNAGHNPPLLFEGGEMRFLESTGIPLGLFAEVDPDVRWQTLSPGALVVLYSDGLTEARNPRGEFYGVDRLIAVVRQALRAEPAALVEKILDDVKKFTGGLPVEDDRTLVVLRVVA